MRVVELTSVEPTGYEMAARLYLKQSVAFLPPSTIEDIVLAKAMDAYDGASNGNKTRGGVKKANDMHVTLLPQRYARDDG